MAFSGLLNRYFLPWTPCCFVQLHTRRKTGNNAVETYPRRSMTLYGSNSFKFIQNWETDALQYILVGGAYFCQQLWQKKMKLAGGFGPLPTLIGSPAFMFSKAYRTHPQNKLLQNERYFAISSLMTHSLSLSLSLGALCPYESLTNLKWEALFSYDGTSNRGLFCMSMRDR